MAESIEIQLPFDIEKMTEEIRKFEFGPKRINCTFQCMCEEGFKSFVFGHEETNKQIQYDKTSSVTSDSCNSSMDSIPYSRPVQSSLKETTLTTHVQGEGLKLSFDVKDYKVEELTVKVVKNTVIIEGQSKATEGATSQVYRNFTRKFTIPDICDKEKIVSTITASGELKVWIPAKEGLPRTSTDRVAELLKHGVVLNSSVESLEDIEKQLGKSPFERVVEIRRVGDRQTDVANNTFTESNERNVKVHKTAEYRRKFEETKQSSKDFSDEERYVLKSPLEREQTSENKVDIKKSGYSKKIVEESTTTKHIVNGVASESKTHERTVEFQNTGAPAQLLEDSRTTSNKVESVQDIRTKKERYPQEAVLEREQTSENKVDIKKSGYTKKITEESTNTKHIVNDVASESRTHERTVEFQNAGAPAQLLEDSKTTSNQVGSVQDIRTKNDRFPQEVVIGAEQISENKADIKKSGYSKKIVEESTTTKHIVNGVASESKTHERTVEFQNTGAPVQVLEDTKTTSNKVESVQDIRTNNNRFPQEAVLEGEETSENKVDIKRSGYTKKITEESTNTKHIVNGVASESKTHERTVEFQNTGAPVQILEDTRTTSNKVESVQDIRTKKERSPQEAVLETEETLENKVDIKRTGCSKKIVEESTTTKQVINGIASESATHERTVEVQQTGAPAKLLEESKTTSNKVESVQDVNKQVKSTEEARTIVSNSLKNHMEKNVHISSNRSVDTQIEQNVSDVPKERIVDIKLTGVPVKTPKESDILESQVTSNTDDVKKVEEQVIEIKQTTDAQDSGVETTAQNTIALSEIEKNIQREDLQTVEETVTKKQCTSELEEKFVKSCNDIITELQQPEFCKERRPDDDVEIESVQSATEDTEFFSQVKRQVNTCRTGSINEGIVQEVPDVHQVKVVREWDHDVDIESVHSLDDRSVDGRTTGEPYRTFILVDEKPEYDSDAETIKSFKEDVVEIKTKKQSELLSKQETTELQEKEDVSTTPCDKTDVVDDQPSPKVWSETKKEVDASKVVDESNVEITKTRELTETKEKSENERHKKEVQTSTERTLEIRQTGVPHNEPTPDTQSKVIEESKTERLVEIKQTGVPQTKTVNVENILKKVVNEETEVTIMGVPKNTEIIVEIKQTKVPKENERVVEVRQTDDVHKTTKTSQTQIRKEHSTDEKVVEIKQTNVPHRTNAEVEVEVSKLSDERDVEIKQTNVPHKTVGRQSTLEVQTEQLSNERVVEVKHTGQLHQTSKVNSFDEHVVEVKPTGVPQKSNIVTDERSNERIVKVDQVNATHKLVSESSIDSNERLVQIKQTGESHNTSKKTNSVTQAVLEDERLVEIKQTGVPQKSNLVTDESSNERIVKVDQVNATHNNTRQSKLVSESSIDSSERLVQIKQTGESHNTSKNSSTVTQAVREDERLVEIKQTGVPQKSNLVTDESSNERIVKVDQVNATHNNTRQTKLVSESSIDSNERLVQIKQTGESHNTSKNTSSVTQAVREDERLVEIKERGVPQKTISDDVLEIKTNVVKDSTNRLQQINQTAGFQKTVEIERKSNYNNGIGYDECTVQVTQAGVPRKTTNSTDIFEKKVDQKLTEDTFKHTLAPSRVIHEVASNESLFRVQNDYDTQKMSQEFENTFKKSGNMEKTVESKERVVEIKQTGSPSKTNQTQQIKSERVVEVKQSGVTKNQTGDVHNSNSQSERLVEIKKTGEFRRNSETTTKRTDNFASKKFTNSFDDHMSHINKTIEKEFGSEHLSSLNEHLEDIKQSAESLRQSAKTERMTNAFEDHFTNSRTQFDSLGKRLGGDIESEIKKTVDGFSSKLESGLKTDGITLNVKKTGATPKIYTRSEVSTQETEIRNGDLSNKHSYQLHENGVLKQSVTGSEQSSHIYQK